MNVLCIDGAKFGDACTSLDGKVRKTVSESEAVYEGETYRVIGEKVVRGINWYNLEGKPSSSFYNEKRFVPVSGIDETKLVNTKEELHA